MTSESTATRQSRSPCWTEVWGFGPRGVIDEAHGGDRWPHPRSAREDDPRWLFQFGSLWAVCPRGARKPFAVISRSSSWRASPCSVWIGRSRARAAIFAKPGESFRPADHRGAQAVPGCAPPPCSRVRSRVVAPFLRRREQTAARENHRFPWYFFSLLRVVVARLPSRLRRGNLRAVCASPTARGLGRCDSLVVAAPPPRCFGEGGRIGVRPSQARRSIAPASSHGPRRHVAVRPCLLKLVSVPGRIRLRAPQAQALAVITLAAAPRGRDVAAPSVARSHHTSAPREPSTTIKPLSKSCTFGRFCPQKEKGAAHEAALAAFTIVVRRRALLAGSLPRPAPFRSETRRPRLAGVRGAPAFSPPTIAKKKKKRRPSTILVTFSWTKSPTSGAERLHRGVSAPKARQAR